MLLLAAAGDPQGLAERGRRHVAGEQGPALQALKPQRPASRPSPSCRIGADEHGGTPREDAAMPGHPAPRSVAVGASPMTTGSPSILAPAPAPGRAGRDAAPRPGSADG